MVFEKNTGLDLETDGAVTLGEKFSHKISANAVITQGVDRPVEDGRLRRRPLHRSAPDWPRRSRTRVQLKLEFQDVYKSRPTGGADKNDIAFITAFVYKF